MNSKYSNAFRDGWDLGSDPIGFVYGYLKRDLRSVGCMADLRLMDREGKSGLLEDSCALLGGTAGIVANVISLGLVNAMRLGEVYCVDDSPMHKAVK